MLDDWDFVPPEDYQEPILLPIVPLDHDVGMMKMRDYQQEAVDAVFSELNTNESTLLVLATGLGKAQPLDEPVLTPSGWRPMGDLQEYDYVIGRNGIPTPIVGVFPQGVKPVLKFTFSDGTSTRCCREHLWNVQTKSHKCRKSGFETKQASELIGDLKDGSGANKWFIPLVDPVRFPHREVPIPPYLLGVLLGDGGLRHRMVVSSIDDFILNTVDSELPTGHSIEHSSGCDWNIKSGELGRKGGKLHQELKALGCRGKYSYEKSIPEIYKINSVETRIGILRGLMDTDGECRSSDGHTEFNTTSRQLADDVCDIVRSLGGVTRVRRKSPGKYTHKGEKRIGRESFRVTVSIDGINPFLLPRKASRYEHGRKQGQTKAIVSIEECGELECQCISVAAEDGLYVTKDYTVTHNTICFAELAYRWPTGRVLIIAHREELIDQAAEKVGHHLDEHPAIEMGERRESRDGHGLLDKSKVLVTSVQTMSRPNRMQWFNPMDFGLIVTDECHHSTSASYRRVYEHFHKNPQLRHVGVTATPKRADEAALGDIFRSVAYEMDIRQGIDEGWLVDVEQKMIVVEGLDFSKCRTTAGDLNQKDIAAAWGFDKSTVQTDDMSEMQREQLEHQEKMLHAVVSPVIQEAQGRPTIIFATTKDHAERLCEICQRHPGVTAEFVTDDTDRTARKEIINRFRSGRTQIFVNVGIATEGFDARVDVVAIARPTKSEALYRQMIGRGTRPLPGIVDKYNTATERRESIANSVKPAMTVLDFLGASGRHNLVSAVDVLGGSYTEDVIEAAKRRLRESGVTRDIDDLLAEEAELAAERKAKAMQLAKEKADREAAAQARLEEERRKRQEEWDKRKSVRGHATYRAENVSPWEPIVIPEQVGVGKFRGGSSDGQVKLLMRLGIKEDAACKYSKGQAGAVIDKLDKQGGGDYIMRFGKHCGRKIRELPRGYLSWAEENMKDARFQSEYQKFLNEPTVAPAANQEPVPF